MSVKEVKIEMAENVIQICRTCNNGIPFTRLKRHPNTKTCSKICSELYWKTRYSEHNFGLGDNKLVAGTVGVIQELRVATDLLIKQYEVFHAFSPSCSCDLAILKNGQLLRVEVTTVHYSASGKLLRARKKDKLFDILALVFRDGRIIYQPELPE